MKRIATLSQHLTSTTSANCHKEDVLQENGGSNTCRPSPSPCLNRSQTSGNSTKTLDPTVKGPLDGIRVVEFTTAVQGPAAGQYLCDMGAEVIKIEPAIGDGPRYQRGTENNLPRDTLMESQFVAFNMGKLSVALDIKHPESFQVLLKLIDSADVFLSNYTHRALGALGLSYEQVKERNPKIIYGVCTGYGKFGPLATAKGFDGAAQARSGLVAINGTQEQPMLVGDIIADASGGIQMALGIMTALVARERFGIGQEVGTSLYGNLLTSQKYSLSHCGITGANVTRQGPHYSTMVGGGGVYKTSCGGALALIFPLLGADTNVVWQDICAFGNQAQYGKDKRFNSVSRRNGNSSSVTEAETNEIKAVLVKVFAARTLKEWEHFFTTKHNVAWAPVLSAREVMQSEHAAANKYIVEVDIPEIGKRKVVGNTVQLSATPGNVQGPPHKLGDDTANVMRELGLPEQHVENVINHTKQRVIERLGEKRAQKIVENF